MINGESTPGNKAFYNLRMQQLQLAIPVPHLQFTRSTQRTLTEDDEKHNHDENNKSNDADCKKKDVRIERIYENEKNIMRVCGKVVKFENKLSDVDGNTFEFCDRFSYNGGGCLKLITRDCRRYHRCEYIPGEK